MPVLRFAARGAYGGSIASQSSSGKRSAAGEAIRTTIDQNAASSGGVSLPPLHFLLSRFDFRLRCHRTMLEPVRLVAGLHDMAVMREPIQ